MPRHNWMQFSSEENTTPEVGLKPSDIKLTAIMTKELVVPVCHPPWAPNLESAEGGFSGALSPMFEWKVWRFSPKFVIVTAAILIVGAVAGPDGTQLLYPNYIKNEYNHHTFTIFRRICETWCWCLPNSATPWPRSLLSWLECVKAGDDAAARK
jgi:hypothetical protein